MESAVDLDEADVTEDLGPGRAGPAPPGVRAPARTC